MPASDPPLTLPVRGVPGGWRDHWDDWGRQEIAGIRSQVAAFDLRTESIAAAWRIEQTRERRRKERDRRRSRKQTHDSRPG